MEKTLKKGSKGTKNAIITRFRNTKRHFSKYLNIIAFKYFDLLSFRNRKVQFYLGIHLITTLC